MTVGELRQILEGLDADMVVMCDRYSDVMEQEPPTVIEVLPVRGGEHWERYYPNQWPKDQPPKGVVRVLHFEGN